MWKKRHKGAAAEWCSIDAVMAQAERVAAVKAYLVGHGIAEGRVTGRGFGGSQPAAANDQEATRKLNRRVEFRVTGTQ